MRSPSMLTSCSLLAVVVAALWHAAASSPLDAPAPNAFILNYDSAKLGVDGYKFAFETSDGVSRQETATLKNAGTEHEAISVQGTVSWTDPAGVRYTLNYLADENGFQPEGEHLPLAGET